MSAAIEPIYSTPPLMEKLADLCHQQWSGWMEWLFKFGTFNENGTFTINSDKVARWRKQMMTPFADLSEDERESDLYEASKFQKLFYTHVTDLKTKLSLQLADADDTADTYRNAGLNGIAKMVNTYTYNVWQICYEIMEAYEYDPSEEGR
uniref:Uncharacterized protein n=1 Tax=viral metagenome TaxID=1070528 RepID=A0A6M3MBD1_9ZZZZ